MFITGLIIVIGPVVAEISPAKGWRTFCHFDEQMRKDDLYI